LNSNK